MKQFKTVFDFEFGSYVKKKSYLVVTVVLIAAMAVILFGLPAFTAAVSPAPGDSSAPEEVAYLDVSGGGDLLSVYNAALSGSGMTLAPYSGTQEQLEQAVDAGEYGSAVVRTGPLSYTRIVRNGELYDSFNEVFGEVVLEQYRADALTGLGVPPDALASIQSAQVTVEQQITESGKDQQQNFLYTYILVFVLYFAILLYGQFVAASVAMEKSSRAMELLITSANPKSLIFGKVLGTGCAGLLQFVLILGSAYLFYQLNAASFTDSAVVQSIFAIPLDILLYAVLFLLLGFFLYAFLYAALGSLVSRMEDLGTTTMPVTFACIAALMVVMTSMGSGQVDNPVMVFCSFFPLTSPVAMFTRIAMGNVAAWEIALSVGILAASMIAVGFLATGIYRLGVLMYGNPPKPGEVVRMLRRQKNA